MEAHAVHAGGSLLWLISREKQEGARLPAFLSRDRPLPARLHLSKIRNLQYQHLPDTQPSAGHTALRDTADGNPCVQTASRITSLYHSCVIKSLFSTWLHHVDNRVTTVPLYHRETWRMEPFPPSSSLSVGNLLHQKLGNALESCS